MFKYTVPLAFALALVIAAVALGNRILFDGWSAAGQVCRDGIVKMEEKEEKLRTAKASFMTNSICWPSGLVLANGHRYRITLTVQAAWIDNDIPADVRGFPSDRLALWIWLPLRRWWTQNWFKPIAQIGKVGNDQYVLGPKVVTAAHKVITDITARSDGELFIFVNDAVAIIPGWLHYFYENNHGTATVSVESLAE